MGRAAGLAQRWTPIFRTTPWYLDAQLSCTGTGGEGVTGGVAKKLPEVLGEPAGPMRGLILPRLQCAALPVQAGLPSPWSGGLRSGGLGRGDLIVVTWCVMTWWRWTLLDLGIWVAHFIVVWTIKRACNPLYCFPDNKTACSPLYCLGDSILLSSRQYIGSAIHFIFCTPQNGSQPTLLSLRSHFIAQRP